MVRTCLGLGAALIFAGAASAQTAAQSYADPDRSVASQAVPLYGQSEHELRVSLRQAAENVCAQAEASLPVAQSDLDDEQACVSDAYGLALRRAKRLAPGVFHRARAEVVAAR